MAPQRKNYSHQQVLTRHEFDNLVSLLHDTLGSTVMYHDNILTYFLHRYQNVVQTKIHQVFQLYITRY